MSANSKGKRWEVFALAANEEKKSTIKEKLAKKKLSQIPNEKKESHKENVDELKKSFAEKETQCKKIFDNLQRTMAEFDNFRKRTEKEKLNIYGNAVCETIEKILPVLDNLERALSSISDKESNYYKGIEMVVKQFVCVLEDLGVKAIKIEPGEDFNHELHCAVAHVEDENLGENQIVDELEKGYKYKDKVIRYSKVRVAN